jgi:hypothetical protein
MSEQARSVLVVVIGLTTFGLLPGFVDWVSESLVLWVLTLTALIVLAVLLMLPLRDGGR